MEQWNDGIMGSGLPLVEALSRRGKWATGLLAKFLFKWKLIVSIYTELPFNPPKHHDWLKSTFQYSTIPLFHVCGISI
jgi:hypothetical protein